MYRLLPFIFLAFVIASCSGKRNIIPPKQMESLLWDVAQSSEFLNSFVYPDHPEQNRAAVDKVMLDRVLKIHKLSRKQFDATLEYYKKRPDDLKILLDTIVARQGRRLGKTPESRQFGIN